MSGISIKGIHSAGGLLKSPATVNDFWFVDKNLVACKGEPIEPHGKRPHYSAVMTEGSDWFKLNGIPVCKSGNEATCKHKVNGSDWFSIS